MAIATDGVPDSVAPAPPRENLTTPHSFDAAFRALSKLLDADFENPIVVRRYRRRRVFVILQAITVTIQPRRRRIGVAGRSGSPSGRQAVGEIGLDLPLTGRIWLGAWLWPATDKLPRPLADAVHAMPAPDCGELVNRLLLHAERGVGLARARRRIRETLMANLDGEILLLARHLNHGRNLSSREYRYAWSHTRDLRRRLAESKRLLPLFSLLAYRCKGEMRPEDGYAALKTQFRSSGLSRAAWKLLCIHGKRLWLPLVDCHEFARRPAATVIEYANLLVACQRRRLPPPALATVFGKHQSLPSEYNDCGAGIRPLFVAAWRHAESRADKRVLRRFLRDELPEVLVWWFDSSHMRTVPPRARWSWFSRMARAARDARLHKSAGWHFVGRSRQIGNHTVSPLRTLDAARATGRRLRNCLMHATCFDDQGVNGLPLFVIEADDRMLAVFSAYQTDTDRWFPNEIRGPCNALVGVQLVLIARRFLRHFDGWQMQSDE